MSYTMTRRLDGPIQDVVDSTVNALEAEEFVVLSDINLQAKLEKTRSRGLPGVPHPRRL